MDTNIELEDLIKEVQRKLGRNVILFQQIEHMLKYMLATQEVKLWKSEEGLQSNVEERKKSFANLTLGNAAKQYVENTFSLDEQFDNNQDNSDGHQFSATFSLGPLVCDEDFYNKRKKELSEIIKERNDLIHHFLPKFNFTEYRSMLKAEEFLDQQRERIIPEYEVIKSIALNFEDTRKELVEFLSSRVGRNWFILSDLRKTHHIVGLIEFANSRKRVDGWALLDSAGLFIRQNISKNQLMDELAFLKKIYQCKTLKEIAVKSEYFDVCEEKTKKGGVRVLYRFKPGLEFNEITWEITEEIT